MWLLSKYTSLKILFLSFILLNFTGCSGEDITGKIVIEYSGDWSAEISIDREKSELSGSGNWEISYKNPEILKATVTKLDTTESKLVLYIYEDERIVDGDSTREPEGSVAAEYEFHY